MSEKVNAAGQASPEYLLEVNHLCKYFNVNKSMIHRKPVYLRAVDDVSFRIRPGETLGVVGESGCGKSTLGNTIIRLLEATSGQVLFDGKDFTALKGAELRKERANIQMIFQDPFSSLNPRMKVFDIIAEPFRTHHICANTQQLREEVFKLMDEVGLPRSSAFRYPHEFSGGQRQRMGIARALALKPKLIICDEPVSALDVSIQAQVLNLLKELQDKFGTAYLFIAHDLSVVQHISDRVAVMYLGKMVEVSDWKTLYSEPHHPYTQSLLSAVPVPDPDIQKTRKRIILAGDPPSPLDPPTGCRFHTRCPIAQGICSEKLPEFKEVAPGHCCACHFAEPFPIKESHIDL